MRKRHASAAGHDTCEMIRCPSLSLCAHREAAAAAGRQAPLRANGVNGAAAAAADEEAPLLQAGPKAAPPPASSSADEDDDDEEGADDSFGARLAHLWSSPAMATACCIFLCFILKVVQQVGSFCLLLSSSAASGVQGLLMPFRLSTLCSYAAV